MKHYKFKHRSWSSRSIRIFMAFLLAVMLIPFIGKGNLAQAQAALPGWTSVGSSLPSSVSSLINVDGTLYAGTVNGVYTYTVGSSGGWSLMPMSGSMGYVSSLLYVGGTLYAGTQYGVYTYTVGSSGGWSPTPISPGNVSSLINVNGTLYAYAWAVNGVYTYTIGSSGGWSLMQMSGWPSDVVYCLLNVGGTLYAGGFDGVYTYTVGSSVGWSRMSGAPSYVLSLLNVGGTLYAGLDSGGDDLYSYSNGIWTPMSGAPHSVNSLLNVGSTLYAGTDNGVYTYTVGSSVGWSSTSMSDSPSYVHSMFIADSNLYATFMRGGSSFGVAQLLISPDAPANLQAGSTTSASTTLTWDAVSGAVTYNVYEGTASGSYGSTPVTTVTGSTYSYTAAGLTNGTTYYFAVTASNAGGSSGYSNVASATPLSMPPPASAPTPTLTPTLTPSPTPTSSDIVSSSDGTLTLSVGKSGEVSLGDGIKIVIPSDASGGKDLKLTIEKVGDTQNLITNKDVLVSPVFEILKNFSENFSKEITLTLAFDPNSLKDKQKPSVFYFDETKKAWVEVGGEVTGGTITVKVNHFTKYAVLGVAQGTDPAADTKQTISFSDIPGHWAEANIKQAVSSGIVSGYPDGTFKPDRTVTRAEFTIMLINALKPQGEGAALTFTDTAKIGAWAQKSVAQALYAGIISGYEDGSFRPDAEITRPEMAMMISKALGQSGGAAAATGFADDKDIPDWAKGAVAAMKKLGIIEGKGTNQFAPGDKTTRAEVVTVLLKMLEQKSKS